MVHTLFYMDITYVLPVYYLASTCIHYLHITCMPTNRTVHVFYLHAYYQDITCSVSPLLKPSDVWTICVNTTFHTHWSGMR